MACNPLPLVQASSRIAQYGDPTKGKAVDWSLLITNFCSQVCLLRKPAAQLLALSMICMSCSKPKCAAVQDQWTMSGMSHSGSAKAESNSSDKSICMVNWAILTYHTVVNLQRVKLWQ